MNFTPRQIVAELDKYIVGQDKAKRAVAIALRNRYRRSKLPLDMMSEVTPKNIIMKGPTGVGKTEIARRLAKLVKAPFIKVEATKYTEVGSVGRDVESMIRDLVESSIRLVREEYTQSVNSSAEKVAYKRLANRVCSALNKNRAEGVEEINPSQAVDGLKAGIYDEMEVEIEVKDIPKPMELVPGGAEINIGTIFGDMMPKRTKKKKMSVKEAKKIFIDEECEKLIDEDAVTTEGVRRAEQEGIIFIDEIDKIAGNSNRNGGPDVSREGVQRDILPIVEGCTVQTKYGPVKTDYILFIAAGAFHVSAVQDLIPELQGRFPVLVELSSLTKDDFVKILTTPKNAITLQYTTLLEVDNIKLVFTADAIEEIANLSEAINERTEDIGARRLHTVMENLLEDISFNAGGDHPMIEVVIDKKYVDEHLEAVVRSQNLKKYIL
ncbi:MAG: ATP-dependent protease ATPase subunit HslU [Clostridia bacterium]|nr:ATP-dependent protease ATPase subunit HslU [Clostridia bacterium]